MDPHVSFLGLLVVGAIAFATPLLLAASPARRLPPVVVLIQAGIVLGPAGLGLAAAPILLTVILIGTSVGIVIPILADVGATRGPFGQGVIAAASVADVTEPAS